MIASINGTVQKRNEDNVVVNVGGIGVRVYVPRTVLEDVGGVGRAISLFTHLIVRETELTLYGFKHEDELSLFEILLGVNGVGPKVALAILSTLSPELLKSAIVREETAVLQRVPGIGKKTAERMMFQLRDKLDFTVGDSAAAVPLVADADAEVIDFLTALGFSIVEAQTALQKIPRDIQTVDEKVQVALQYLGQQ
ncbi:MAG: Holliday junction branch migration protein RuvA [Anaerolineales bacterium]|nr:Holliday junction branch migration protein RuvA [Anaerolineales bacterium]